MRSILEGGPKHKAIFDTADLPTLAHRYITQRDLWGIPDTKWIDSDGSIRIGILPGKYEHTGQLEAGLYLYKWKEG